MGTNRADSLHKRLRKSPWFVLVVISVAAFNLRPAVASVGPVADQIHFADFSGSIGAGLLVSTPVLLFGIANPLFQRLARRWNLTRIVLLSLIVLAISIALRSFGGVSGLLIGTLSVGISIAFVNIALPAVLKGTPDSTGGTGLYTGSLSAGAAIAAGATLPLAHVFDLDWRMALAMWAIPALIAVVFWWQMPRLATPGSVSFREHESLRLRTPSKEIGVWMIAGFFGCQSMLYYSVTTWLPSMLQSQGVSPILSGTLLSLINWAGIPAALIIPQLCRFVRGPLIVAVFCGAAWVAGLGMTFTFGSVIIGAILIGLAQGASLSFGLVLIVIWSRDERHAIAVSGMVQGFGYVLAAFGPVAAGAAIAMTGTWIGVEIGLFVIALAMVSFGVVAYRQVRRRPDAARGGESNFTDER